jgi:MFS family permease
MVFLVEVIGFLLASIALLRLPMDKKETIKNKESGLFWSDFADGIRYIRSNRILVFTIGSMTFSMVIISLYDKLIVLWAKNLGIGVDGFGTILSAVAVGSIVGTFLITPISRLFENPLMMSAAAGLLGGGVWLLIGIGGWGWFTAPFFVWVVVWFWVGIISLFSSITYTTLIQSETPPEMIGRIIAVTHGFQNTALLISPLIGAVLAKWIGIGGVFFFAGVSFILFCSLSPWLIKRYKLEPTKDKGEN